MTYTDPTNPGLGDTGLGDAGTGESVNPAADAKSAVKKEAQNFAAAAQQKAAGEIEKHKQTATNTLGQVAEAIRRAGDQLSEGDAAPVSRYVSQAADGIENFTRSLSDMRPEEMADAVRDFSRRNPAVVLAGAVLAGVALGRFLRSSEQATGAGEPQPYLRGAGASETWPETTPYEGGDTGLGAGEADSGSALDDTADRTRFTTGA
ncbi:hypothetical protein [Phenylobacterium sp.]|jgi:hypothetical protein|uniref:hypothetical protein n=1 Tax=Phenylobacterium sp. TaxID=1871053 RepID=UPI0037830384